MDRSRAGSASVAGLVLVAMGHHGCPGGGGGRGQIELVGDATVDVGVVDLGATASATFVLANVGGGPAHPGAVELSEPGSFVELGRTCGAVLAPGHTCTVTIGVQPVRAGPLAGDVTFHASSGDLDAQIAATGRAHVTVAVSGPGRVTSDPIGVDCAGPATCAASFVVADVVLRASDDVTVRWSGACAGNGACALTLDDDLAVNAATFAPIVWIEGDPHGSADTAYGVAIDAGDRRIVTGEGLSHLTGEAWTSAFTPADAIAWTDRFDPGAEGHDMGRAVAIAPDGSIVVAGQWYSSSNTRWNRLLRRLSAAGAVVSSQEGEDVGDDGYRGVAIDPTSGALWLVGFQPDPGEPWPASYVQGWIGRATASGVVQWARAWSGTGTGDDLANDVAIDASGDGVVVGTQVDVGTGADAWIAIYAPTGALVWSDLRATAGADEALSVAIAADGRIAVVGRQDGAGWLAIYDAAHVLVDEASFPEVARWQGVAFAANGDLIVTGGDQTRRIGADGATVWSRTSAGLEGRDIAIDHAGNVIVVGEIDARIALVEYVQ